MIYKYFTLVIKKNQKWKIKHQAYHRQTGKQVGLFTFLFLPQVIYVAALKKVFIGNSDFQQTKSS